MNTYNKQSTSEQLFREAYEKHHHVTKDQHRVFTPWMSSRDNQDWTNEVYSECYPMGKTKSHRATFDMVLNNLAVSRNPLSILLHRRHYRKFTKKPKGFTPTNLSDIARTLHRKKFITLDKGYTFKNSQGVASVIQSTPKLNALIPSKLSVKIKKEGLIILKEMKQPDVFPDHVKEALEVLTEYNQTVETENQLYAVYKGGLEVDGRFHGSSVITMQKDARKDLRIDDCETFEIDISNCIPFLLYASELNCEAPSDTYDIHGIPRDLTKVAMLTLLNCESRTKAVQGLQGEINLNPKYRGLFKATEVLQKLEGKHSRLSEFFYTGIGRKLMNIESRCMCQFLKETLGEGVKVYPIYDSAIGKKADQEFIEEVFKRSFTVNGVEPVVH